MYRGFPTCSNRTSCIHGRDLSAREKWRESVALTADKMIVSEAKLTLMIGLPEIVQDASLSDLDEEAMRHARSAFAKADANRVLAKKKSLVGPIRSFLTVLV